MPLSSQCKEIILGSLLGDGSLQINAQYVNARFAFRHSVKQEEYFWWKARQLAEIASERHAWRQGVLQRDGWGTEKLRFQSRALNSLTELYQLTRRKGRTRVRRKWLNMLTPLSLAVWWLDDGSLVGDSRQGVFCTDGFLWKEVRLLRQYLQKVWTIRTTIGRVGSADRYRLWIQSTSELQKFLCLILPYIRVASMLPKVLLLYKDPQLQQRWISEVTKHTGFPRDVVERHVAEKKARWKRFRE